MGRHLNHPSTAAFNYVSVGPRVHSARTTDGEAPATRGWCNPKRRPECGAAVASGGSLSSVAASPDPRPTRGDPGPDWLRVPDAWVSPWVTPTAAREVKRRSRIEFCVGAYSYIHLHRLHSVDQSVYSHRDWQDSVFRKRVTLRVRMRHKYLLQKFWTCQRKHSLLEREESEPACQSTLRWGCKSYGMKGGQHDGRQQPTPIHFRIRSSFNNSLSLFINYPHPLPPSIPHLTIFSNNLHYHRKK